MTEEQKKRYDEYKKSLKKQIMYYRDTPLEVIIENTSKADPNSSKETEQWILDAINKKKKQFFNKIGNKEEKIIVVPDILEVTRKQLFELSVEELLKIGIVNWENKTKHDIEEYAKYAREQKEKYDGITNEELDDYVDLMVSKDILVANKQAEIEEVEEKAREHSKLNQDISLSPYIASIESIEELDETTKNSKEWTKKELKKFLKMFSIGTLSTTTALSYILLCTAPSTLAGVSLMYMPILALMGAIGSIQELRNLLSLNKYEDKIKELKIYELLTELTELKEEQKELEEKGRVR